MSVGSSGEMICFLILDVGLGVGNWNPSMNPPWPPFSRNLMDPTSAGRSDGTGVDDAVQDD